MTDLEQSRKRVMDVNAQGKRRRDALEKLRAELDGLVAKQFAKLAKRYPGHDFTRDVAMMLEQRGQLLRAQVDEVEQRRRHERRSATLAAESQEGKK